MLALIRVVENEKIKDVRAFDFSSPLIMSCTIQELQEAIEAAKEPVIEIPTLSGPRNTNVITCSSSDAEWKPSLSNRCHKNNSTYILTMTGMIKCDIINGDFSSWSDVLVVKNPASARKMILMKNTAGTGLMSKPANIPQSDTLINYNRPNSDMKRLARDPNGWRRANEIELEIYNIFTNKS